tara:strand:+ start:717 stop:1172 length:456 start_codon:yes stop_codon:yes gene_type:complete
MVRPSDSRGRDRTRSIQLDGRVSEIAQNLASQGKLSSVLSNLLYEKYGHTSKRAKLEAKLAELDAERAEIELRKGQVKKALELHENNQKRNAHKIAELEIQLESMIKSVRETEAMIQTGHTVNAGGISYEKVKRNQSELVEKFRRQLEELK